ncbi:MAG: FAD-dependent oxidoreductase, partial [bacterium]
MLLTSQQATTESERCLYCFDAPCMQACPVHIDIPKFISMIKSGNVIGAAKVVKTSHALANVCGKVCPEEIFCQSVCNRSKQDTPIQIRELHFFATQHEAKNGFAVMREFPKNGKKVSVIGAGPAGLGCAFELSKLGHDVHVYDAKGFGGVPRNSIPVFRLSADELRSDIEFISPCFHSHQMNVDSDAFAKIHQQSDAVFVSVGLGLDKRLQIRGEHLIGVFPVLKFLEDAKKGGLRNGVGKRVVIIGGGNVSL